MKQKSSAIYKLDTLLPGKFQSSTHLKDRTFQELLDGDANDILTLIKFRQHIVDSNGLDSNGKPQGYWKFVDEINLALDLYIHTNAAALASTYKPRYTKQRLKLELSHYDQIQKEEARQMLIAKMEVEARDRLEKEAIENAKKERLMAYGDTLGSW